MNENIAKDKSISAKELAIRWSTSTGRLANMRSKGTGPAFFNIGTAIRYRVSVIESYEGANTTQPFAA